MMVSSKPHELNYSNQLNGRKFLAYPLPEFICLQHPATKSHYAIVSEIKVFSPHRYTGQH